jgi:hypothetical protein
MCPNLRVFANGDSPPYGSAQPDERIADWLVGTCKTPPSTLADHYRDSIYRHDDDCVFAHPKRDTHPEFSPWYPEQFGKALAAAGITDYVLALPRHAAHRAHETRRDERQPDRGHGDRRTPFDADDEATSPPGGCRISRRCTRAQEAMLETVESSTNPASPQMIEDD